MKRAAVPIARPDLGDEEAEAVARVVRSGWVAQGPEVAAFEGELAALVGARAAVATANGTVALEVALRALGVGPGDEVVTVSHSFIATANAVAAVGATPVFVDVEADTFGMDPSHVEPALSPRTRAILCVHQLGIPCDASAIAAVAGRYGVPLVEDAACALGSELTFAGQRRAAGRPCGALACFSFHPRKLITTGEGGMVTTDDRALEERMRRLRNHGLGTGGHVEPGFNARLSDLHAAIGRVQLRRLPEALARRAHLAEELSALLVRNAVLAPPPAPRAGSAWNWQSYPAGLRPDAPDAAAVVAFLQGRGIDARPGVTNAHQEPAYGDPRRHRIGPAGLAVSERLRARTVLLPLFHGMRDDERAALRDAVRAMDDRFRRGA